MMPSFIVFLQQHNMMIYFLNIVYTYYFTNYSIKHNHVEII